MKMKMANSIAQTLRKYDTEYFFLMSGADPDLYAAVHDAEIRWVLCRSEKAAVYMADGYARISYKPGFVYGWCGPGAANVAAGMADPFWACSPVVAITSSTATSSRYKRVYQELDQMPMFDPVTKWNGCVCAPERAPELIRNAIRLSLSGCPGPTHLDIPWDFMGVEVEVPEIYAEESCREVPAIRCSPDRSKIVEAANLLATAERPVIVAGSGVVLSRAWDELVQLAELLSIPVATSLGGKGSIPEDHPLSIGVLGKYSRKSANDLVMRSDLTVFVGSKLGATVTNLFSIPRPGTRIIHIDLAPEVLGKTYKTELPIFGDAKLALRALTEVLLEKRITRPLRNPWADEARDITSQWRKEFESIATKPSLPMKPQTVIKILRESLGKNDIVVADTGYMAAWTGALFDVLSAGRTYIRAAGSLGWALPASIGAKLAAPDRNVVCVIGDGGIGYHISELETALRLKVPVVVLVLNNSSLAYVDHDKYLMPEGYGKVASEVADFLELDYGRIASAFGVYGRRVDKPEELNDALKQALDLAKPALLDVIVDKKEIAPVTDYEPVFGRKI
jgi:acetolactate synthase-1/2/3 large subunit